MDITKSETGDGVVLALKGRFNTTTSPAVQDALLAELGEARNVTIDFKGVDYVSSSGLRVLLLGQRTAMANRCLMTVVNVSPAVREILDMTGLATILKLA